MPFSSMWAGLLWESRVLRAYRGAPEGPQGWLEEAAQRLRAQALELDCPVSNPSSVTPELFSLSK